MAARPECSFTVGANDFLLDAKAKSYTHQFANLYYMRLLLLRENVRQRAAAKWADSGAVHVSKVLEVQKGHASYIVGTIYMDMRLKPNILDDIGKDHHIAPTHVPDKIYSDSDVVLLEDESGRIKLVGEALKKFHFVTGVIVAALGCENDQGEFEVADLCFTEPAPRAVLSDVMEVDDTPDTTVAFVSGLDFGGKVINDMSVELLLDYLESELGDESDRQQGARVSRLVIVGNSLAEMSHDEEKEDPPPVLPSQPVDALGSFLINVCRQMPVHLLPGPTDPTGTTLPQQPMPSAVFGEVHRSDNFRCETNPTFLNFDRCNVLAISGQNIDDICKYTSRKDRLAMARDTLRWRHIAPTAPDTLWCYPYFEKDPFALQNSPHVYVIGNQPSFGTEIVEDAAGLPIRVILLPSFAETGTVALLNTQTLDARAITFRAVGWPLS